MTRERRTVLNVVQVSTPCPVRWETMEGDERVRFCDGCGRHVHNLSAMATDEAELLICQAAGRLCVRFSRAADGAVETIDYRPQPPPKSRWARWRWPAWAGVGIFGAAAVAVAQLLLFGTSLFRPQQPTVTVGVMITTPVAPSGADDSDLSPDTRHQIPQQ